MRDRSPLPGSTQAFVMGKGFETRFGKWLLVDHEDHARWFLELAADPDPTRSDPATAFEEFLRGLLPGTAVRFLTISWPASNPRVQFLQLLHEWEAARRSDPHLTQQLLSLEAFLRTAPLPYFRLVILEVVVDSAETLDRIAASLEILSQYGIQARELSPQEVQNLAHSLFNPTLGE